MNLDGLTLSLTSHQMSTEQANTFWGTVLNAGAVGRGVTELVTHSNEHGSVVVLGLDECSLAEAEGASEEVTGVTLGRLSEPNELLNVHTEERSEVDESLLVDARGELLLGHFKIGGELDSMLSEHSGVVVGDGTFEHLVKERRAIGGPDDLLENLTNKRLHLEHAGDLGSGVVR